METLESIPVESLDEWAKKYVDGFSDVIVYGMNCPKDASKLCCVYNTLAFPRFQEIANQGKINFLESLEILQ